MRFRGYLTRADRRTVAEEEQIDLTARLDAYDRRSHSGRVVEDSSSAAPAAGGLLAEARRRAAETATANERSAPPRW